MWTRDEADEGEGEGELVGWVGEGEGVGAAVYAQRVLLLMRTLHADVPALLQR